MPRHRLPSANIVLEYDTCPVAYLGIFRGAGPAGFENTFKPSAPLTNIL